MFIFTLNTIHDQCSLVHVHSRLELVHSNLQQQVNCLRRLLCKLNSLAFQAYCLIFINHYRFYLLHGKATKQIHTIRRLMWGHPKVPYYAKYTLERFSINNMHPRPVYNTRVKYLCPFSNVRYVLNLCPLSLSEVSGLFLFLKDVYRQQFQYIIFVIFVCARPLKNLKTFDACVCIVTPSNFSFNAI